MNNNENYSNTLYKEVGDRKQEKKKTICFGNFYQICYAYEKFSN